LKEVKVEVEVKKLKNGQKSKSSKCIY